MSVRAPAVAGTFYPDNPAELRQEIARFLEAQPTAEKVPALGVLAPHAGYIYSGAVAGQVYRQIQPAPLCILLGPNHTGLGLRASLWPGGPWQTPLGEVQTDQKAISALLDSSQLLEADPQAHLREHCLEVQAPFLQHLDPAVRIVPIVLSGLSYKECRRLGEELAAFARAWPERVLLLASSDMNHYLPDALTRRLDRHAIDRIEALDPEGLYKTVRDEGLSMCGVIPATVTLTASLALGASHARLAAYATSGDAFGDRGRVVGYAGMIFW